jgi:dihydroorotase
MIALTGGTIIDPIKGALEGKDLLIKGRKILDIINRGALPKEGEIKVVDVSGLYLLPGFVDIHTHLREPGFEWKEDIESGTRSAVAGGFTSVACMANTDPVNDTPETTRYIIERARKSALAKVYPVAAITRGLAGRELTDFGELIDAGVVAFSDDGKPLTNPLIMMRALEYGKRFNIPLILHEEDPDLSGNGCINDGEVSARTGLPAIPSISESVMVARDLLIAEYTGGKVHFAHISTRESVQQIREGKRRGVSITAETAPHYLSLTEEATLGFNTNAKMNPPLRSKEDQRSLEEALIDGTIDCIATDHAPHETLLKNCEFQEAAFGIIGHQTAFPIVYEKFSALGLGLKELVKVLSYNPSNILNIRGGIIENKSPADIAIVSTEVEYEFLDEMILSKSRNSPFIGCRMKGKVVCTLVDGKVNFQDEELMVR